MNGLIGWWARNSVAANLLMILILIAGLMQFTQLEREEFPSPAFNFVNVSRSWPGAGPRDVEEQIIVRIEEALSDLDGVDTIVANAREGSANVTVEMKEGSGNIEDFLAEVKNQVDAISNFP
ncbi:MAG: efflux RND transporter permease subunit, partial [Pseudomonadota bacterium]